MVLNDGYPLGFGKLNKGTLKNKYCSGWRLL
ncbi:MAG: methyltransferase RsmF C-terminal domain-like protein [Blautia sp.]